MGLDVMAIKGIYKLLEYDKALKKYKNSKISKLLMFNFFNGVDMSKYVRTIDFADKTKAEFDKTLQLQGALRVGDVDTGLKDSLNCFVIASAILCLSNVMCPVDTGALKKSGHVENNGDECKVIYDKPYAVHVHELIGNRHLSPTQAKFLEDACYELQDTLRSNARVNFKFNMVYEDNGEMHALIHDVEEITEDNKAIIDSEILGEDANIEELEQLLGVGEL